MSNAALELSRPHKARGEGRGSCGVRQGRRPESANRVRTPTLCPPHTRAAVARSEADEAVNDMYCTVLYVIDVTA